MKSKLAHLDNILFYTLCAAPLLIFVILGFKLLALVYNYSSPDFGSWPDWLSLLANIVIAFFTFVVAKNAKSFFNDKIHAEGFNRTSMLMDDLDSLYKKVNKAYFKTHTIASRFDLSLSKENNGKIHYEKVIENAEALLDEISDLQSDLFNIKVNTRKLSRWSLRNNKKDDFNQLIMFITKFLEDLNSVVKYVYLIKNPDEIISSDEYHEKIRNSHDQKHAIDVYYNYFATIPLKDLFSIVEKDV